MGFRENGKLSEIPKTPWVTTAVDEVRTKERLGVEHATTTIEDTLSLNREDRKAVLKKQ
jgi:hypothetical protein